MTVLVYASAMALTCVLAYFAGTVYRLDHGARVIRLRGAVRAFFVLLPLTLVALLRWNVGVDSLYGGSYWQSYRAAWRGVNSRGFEPGFYAMLRVFSKLRVPFFWFLAVLALLFMACVSVAISRGSVWPVWSLLVFFLLFVYFDSYSALRQSLAEAVSLLGWAQMSAPSRSRRRDARILALFLLAGLFHRIALINIPIYLVCRIRLSQASLLLFLLAGVILSPAIQAVLRAVMRRMAGVGYSFQGVARINALLTGALALACWLSYGGICRLGDSAYMYVNQAVCIFLLILNSGAMYLPFRVFDMLKIGYVLIIPYLLRGIRSGRARLGVALGLLLMLGAWFFNQFFLQDSYVAHYDTVLRHWMFTSLP